MMPHEAADIFARCIQTSAAIFLGWPDDMIVASSSGGASFEVRMKEQTFVCSVQKTGDSPNSTLREDQRKLHINE